MTTQQDQDPESPGAPEARRGTVEIPAEFSLGSMTLGGGEIRQVTLEMSVVRLFEFRAVLVERWHRDVIGIAGVTFCGTSCPMTDAVDGASFACPTSAEETDVELVISFVNLSDREIAFGSTLRGAWIASPSEQGIHIPALVISPEEVKIPVGIMVMAGHARATIAVAPPDNLDFLRLDRIEIPGLRMLWVSLDRAALCGSGEPILPLESGFAFARSASLWPSGRLEICLENRSPDPTMFDVWLVGRVGRVSSQETPGPVSDNPDSLLDLAGDAPARIGVAGEGAPRSHSHYEVRPVLNVDVEGIRRLTRAALDRRTSGSSLVSINGDVLLALASHASELAALFDLASLSASGLASGPASDLARRGPVVAGDGAAEAWGSVIDLVPDAIMGPSADELAGLRQIRAGEVTSVRQAEMADAWIDRLSSATLDHAAIIARSPRDLVGEAAYLDLMRRILDHGERRSDRTGTGTLSIFGAQMRFDLRDGFPLVTTKKVHFAAIVRELVWFLRGSTNIHDDLTQHTKIWNEWADADGDLGPVYGFQWRHWGADHDKWKEGRLGGMPAHERSHSALGIDQITQAINQIRNNPNSRRIIVSAWNVADVPKMRLPPCHLLFQFNVVGEHLDCQLYQRSADMALGVPFNIASYALLTSMIAMECGLVARHFVHSLGDAHVYLNHVDGVREQLTRALFPPPRLVLSDKPTLEQTFEDVSIKGYQHHPAIKFEVSV